MINTAIVQSCSSRSDSMEGGRMVFRELNNSLIFFVFSVDASIVGAQLSGPNYHGPNCWSSLMSKPLFLSDIFGSSIFFFWRRLKFSCSRSVLLRPEQSLISFKQDTSVFYFLTFFQTVILVCETLSRKSCSKSYWRFVKLLVFR